MSCRVSSACALTESMRALSCLLSRSSLSGDISKLRRWTPTISKAAVAARLAAVLRRMAASDAQRCSLELGLPQRCSAIARFDPFVMNATANAAPKPARACLLVCYRPLAQIFANRMKIRWASTPGDPLRRAQKFRVVGRVGVGDEAFSSMSRYFFQPRMSRRVLRRTIRRAGRRQCAAAGPAGKLIARVVARLVGHWSDNHHQPYKSDEVALAGA